MRRDRDSVEWGKMGGLGAVWGVGLCKSVRTAVIKGGKERSALVMIARIVFIPLKHTRSISRDERCVFGGYTGPIGLHIHS